MPLTVYQIQRTDLALLDLQNLLRVAESTFYKNENKRICAFTLADPAGPDQGHNVVAIDDAAAEPGPMVLKSFDAALEEIDLAAQLVQLEQQGALRVRCYDVVLLAGKPAYVAVCDPVTAASPPVSQSLLTVQGKMSTFGGSKDTGMGFAENLAWIENEPEAASYPGYFVSGLPGEGYGRRLDASSTTNLYLACRWDYNVTPKHFLAQPTTVCTVVNPANGKTAQARPVDWGPSDSKPGAKDRVADLSPALADILELTTDQVCVVQTPTPGNVPAPATPTQQPEVVAAGQRRVVMLTGDYVGKHVRQAQAKAAGCALSIEFHFNSNGRDAKHSGVYFKHQDARSEAAATLFQDGFDRLFADKPGWGGSTKDSSEDGGRSSFIDRYSQPAVLIEPLFVSNPDQAAWIHDDDNVGLLARVVADALIAATADGDLIGLSIGHLGKDSSPGDRGAACCLGDTEATHGSKLALTVCQLLSA